MAYLLDTDILIDYQAGDPAIKQLLDPLKPAPFAISVIARMEVLQGILLGPDPIAMRQAFDQFLTGIDILPITNELAERCARNRADLTRRGRRVRPRALDLLVAATAIEHGLTLVTRNKADYQDIPNLSLYCARTLSA
jgi:predicted nucleic acid-binding protein